MSSGSIVATLTLTPLVTGPFEFPCRGSDCVLVKPVTPPLPVSMSPNGSTLPEFTVPSKPPQQITTTTPTTTTTTPTTTTTTPTTTTPTTTTTTPTTTTTAPTTTTTTPTTTTTTPTTTTTTPTTTTTTTTLKTTTRRPLSGVTKGKFFSGAGTDCEELNPKIR